MEALLDEFEIIAALWSHTKESFSVQDFVNSEAILIVGSDPGFSHSLGAVNDLLFTVVTERLLAQPKSRERRSHFILDEFTAMNDDRPVRSIRNLTQRGRGRGVDVTIMYQSIEDMKAIYGKFASGILGQFRNRLFLATGDPETAKYNAEKLSGGHWKPDDFMTLRPASIRGRHFRVCRSRRGRSVSGRDQAEMDRQERCGT